MRPGCGGEYLAAPAVLCGRCGGLVRDRVPKDLPIEVLPKSAPRRAFRRLSACADGTTEAEATMKASGRQSVLEGCGHKHMGIAEPHEAGTFRVFYDATFK